MTNTPASPSTPRSRSRSGSGGGAAIIAALAIALYLVSPVLTRRLAPNAYSGGRSQRQNDIVQRNSSSIGLILGELRSSMSDLMYIKTERYLDQGIAYYPHIDMKAMESEGAIKTKAEEAAKPGGTPGTGPAGHADHETDHDHEADHEENTTGTVAISDIQFLQGHHRHEGEADDEHEHEGEAATGAAGDAGESHSHAAEYTKTIIRTGADDFRGFIGYLERHVKPWRDPRLPHHHTDGTELLPWFRLQTLSDPHNVRSYLIGSWWLKEKDEPQVREALKFVEEGIRNNPDAFQLQLMKGSILRRLGREAESLPAFIEGANLALRVRPPDGEKNPKAEVLGWDRYKEQDARTSARMAVLVAKELGHRDQALELVKKYNSHFAGDGILERQLKILTGQEPDPMAGKKMK